MWRVYVVAGVMALGFAALGLRAFELQVRERDFLTSEGDRRHIRALVEPGGRGAIRDRNGQPLAISAPVESIWVVPSALLQADEYIPPLARLLDEKPDQLRQTLEAREGRQFYFLRRQLAPADAQRILALDAPGVFAQREYRRYYPAGEVAAQLVGLCGIDDVGIEGIELGFDSLLTGAPGRRLVVQDRLGRVVEDASEYQPSAPGQDLDLTIDLRLQHIAYRELKAAVKSHKARGGVVLVADALSGDVLALATQPGFNPNDREGLARHRSAWRNRAVIDQFEPGSTVKPLLVAAALQSGVVTPDVELHTGNGYLRVGRLNVRDSHGYGDINLTTLLAKSSNVGATKLGLMLGADRLYNYYRSFGFGMRTGSGFPGESAGRLNGPYEWGQVGTATASYGYGLGVTALQLAQGYMALAADGIKRPLKLVVGGLGLEEERVLDADVAREVRRMLVAVTRPGGTGQAAAVPGYSVAGKTGTVRKVAHEGYSGDQHQAMFVGMLPAEQPRVLTLVMIDDPRAGAIYGGDVAAPVFANVAGAAARLLQVVPRDAPTVLARAGDAS